MPHLSIALLGPVTVALDGAPVVAFDYAKVRALLVYLAVERSRPHRRDAIAELLWPDQPEQVGRNSLRQALAKLRQVIHDHDARPPFLVITRETLQFNPASDWSLDVAAFSALAEACARHRHQAPARCGECAERWERAVALYRGAFAEDLAPRDSTGFEEWALVRREWFERQALIGLNALASFYAEQGDSEPALLYARRILELDPWHEAAHRQVMRLLAAQGQRSAALAQYESCRRTLAEALGVEPEEETTALYEQLKREKLIAPSTSTASVTLSPPHLVALSALPPQPSSFIGREQELSELEAMLNDPECRLITLLGPGGIGKTRLALRLAEASSASFRDGVFWVPLAPVTSASNLVDSIARALGCALDGADDALAVLLEFVRPRAMLLLLDSFEHLLDGSDALVRLLDSAPQLKLVVTSRERLELQREWLYDVEGLPHPQDGQGDEADTCPAVQLLLGRARQVRRLGRLSDHERQAVRRIAQVVEGMPLALELAAAASRELSFAAIAQAIAHNLDLLRASFRDMPERHRSVRAALEHSWRLLAPPEQAVLAALSVFRGGFDAQAAREVGGASTTLLEALLAKSLVRRQGDRYDMHELIRQFAQEQLEASGQAGWARAAHLLHYRTLAETAEPQLLGAEQEVWLPQLEREHANIRAALAWGLEQPDAEPAARLAGALWRFWWMRAHVSEGRRWLEALLARYTPDIGVPAGGSTSAGMAVWSKVAKGAGNLANEQGDYERAQACYRMSLAIEERLGNQRGIANILSNLALVTINQGELPQAQSLLERALAIYHQIGHERGVAIATDGLAEIAYSSGDYQRARALYRQSLALHQASGDRHSAAIAIHNLSDIARAQGDYASAAAGARENVELFRELGNRHGVAVSLHILGVAARVAGEYDQARALHAEALDLLHHGGHRLSIVAGLLGIAAVADAEGQWQRAARLCGAAEALRQAIRATLLPADRQDYERTCSLAQAALGQAGWAAAWAAGQALSMDAAIAYACDKATELS